MTNVPAAPSAIANIDHPGVLMAVYNPSGSGNVHTDRVMSGGKKMAKKAMPKKMAKAMPPQLQPKKGAKKAAPKKAGY